MVVILAAASDVQAKKFGKLLSQLLYQIWSNCTRCGRILIPFQPEQTQFCISHLLKESQLWAARERNHTTLFMVKLFQFSGKDCKICWATEKKRMTGTLLYSLLVRHSHDRKKTQVLVPASQNITAFPNTLKQIKKKILEMNQLFPVKMFRPWKSEPNNVLG